MWGKVNRQILELSYLWYICIYVYIHLISNSHCWQLNIQIDVLIRNISDIEVYCEVKSTGNLELSYLGHIRILVYVYVHVGHILGILIIPPLPYYSYWLLLPLTSWIDVFLIGMFQILRFDLESICTGFVNSPLLELRNSQGTFSNLYQTMGRHWILEIDK